MLSISERSQAIEILVNNQTGRVNGNWGDVANVMRYGFRGYASFSDKELLRQLNDIAKNYSDYSAQQLLAGIAAEKFLLE